MTAPHQEKIKELNLKNNGERTTIKINLGKKRFMIIQKVAKEEGVEGEVAIKIKVFSKETGIQIGVQIKIIKIETRIEMSIKITNDKDIKIRDGKITTQIKAGALKITIIMTDNRKDMTTTTIITEDIKKASKKLMKKKETITWEKWEVKLQAMMMMLIINEINAREKKKKKLNYFFF